MRIFDIPDVSNEATTRQIRFLRSFLFDNTCTDENWHASMAALFTLLVQQLMRSDDRPQSFLNAIELLHAGLAQAGKS